MNKIRKDTQESDALILSILKKFLNLEKGKKEKIMILEDDKLTEICNKLEQRKKYLYSLFGDDFSAREQEIKDNIFIKKINIAEKDILSKVADSILNKKINKIFNHIIDDEALSTWTRIVAMDRKLFINFLLEENIEIKEPNKEKNIKKKKNKVIY